MLITTLWRDRGGWVFVVLRAEEGKICSRAFWFDCRASRQAPRGNFRRLTPGERIYLQRAAFVITGTRNTDINSIEIFHTTCQYLGGDTESGPNVVAGVR